jgi:hypothetical protein
LLGVLAFWAGLRIQSRKSSNTLSTLIPPTGVGQSAVNAPANVKLELPEDITSLNLNLDSNSLPPKMSAGVKMPASTETLQ